MLRRMDSAKRLWSVSRGAGGMALVAWVLVLAGAQAGARAGTDILGGDPIHSQVNVYTAQNWSAYLTSFVYDASSNAFPNNIPATPGPGETLFVYLLENTGIGGDPAITAFTVANSFPAQPIVSIGHSRNTTVSPGDLQVSGSMQIPNTSTVNPFSMVFTWQNGLIFDPDPIVTSVLQPNNYSIQYFIAEGSWTLQNGTIQSSAAPETQLVPGPFIPEPGALALLGAGAAALLIGCGRRSRRAVGALLPVIAATSVWAQAPGIGGTPSATATTEYHLSDSQVTVHSYFYAGADVPPEGFNLQVGEALFFI